MYDIFLIFFYKNNKFSLHSFKYPEQVTGWFCLFGLKLLWGLTFGFKLKVFCLIVLWPFFVSLQLGVFGVCSSSSDHQFLCFFFLLDYEKTGGILKFQVNQTLVRNIKIQPSMYLNKHMCKHNIKLY